MTDTAPAVALLFDDTELGGQLREALQERGARIVHEGGVSSLSRELLQRVGADVLVVNLDDSADDALDHLYEVIDDDRPRVVFNDAQASRALAGWDRARWARHLAVKVLAVGDIDPPRPDDARLRRDAGGCVGRPWWRRSRRPTRGQAGSAVVEDRAMRRRWKPRRGGRPSPTRSRLSPPARRRRWSARTDGGVGIGKPGGRTGGLAGLRRPAGGRRGVGSGLRFAGDARPPPLHDGDFGERRLTRTPLPMVDDAVRRTRRTDHCADVTPPTFQIRSSATVVADRCRW